MQKEILKDAGLSDREIDIYLALLKIGKASVSYLAKITGLHRTNIYDIIEKLKEKGLVASLNENNKNEFTAVEPQRLLDILDEKKENLKSLLPSLEKFMQSEKSEPKINIYKGKEGLKIVLREAVSEGKDVYGIGVDEEKWFMHVPLQFEQYIKGIERSNIHEKLLTKEGATYFTGSKNSEYRFVPKEFFGPTSTLIYGKKVAMHMWEPVIITIKIESEAVAEDFKKNFMLLWKMGKVKKEKA